MQRRRLQKGSLTLRSGTWYARYYVNKNGSRKMVSHKLAVKTTSTTPRTRRHSGRSSKSTWSK
jgi:hypothetical protein